MPIINGSSASEILEGTIFDDLISGFSGNDTLRGVQGGDTLDGGPDIDTVDYSASDAAVFVSLFSNTGEGGHAQGDKFVSIENLIGSGFDDGFIGSDDANTIRSGAGDDVVFGSGGNDILIGGSGGDSLNGGNGIDLASWEGSVSGVTVNLLSGNIGGGDATGDTLDSIENLRGSSFGDTLTGDDSDNFIDGAGGDDVLDGARGNDQLVGGAGNDQLLGGAESDFLTGGLGADFFDGGTGVDAANYSTSQFGVIVSLATGVGTDGDAVGDVLVSIENLQGSNSNDVLEGNNNANAMNGRDGADTLRGLGSSDLLSGQGGADLIDGGEGLDTADYSSSAAGVIAFLDVGGGSGGDAEGDVFISIENLNGSVHEDVLGGSSGNNKLLGLGGSDTLVGSGGEDRLEGGEGADSLSGGLDDDRLFGGAGADTLDGGDGFDIADYSDASAGVGVNLLTGVATGGEAEGDTFTSIEDVRGSSFGDVITGNDGANKLLGQDGDDDLFGNAGVDTLQGGGGNDVLDGGVGADVLNGGSGDDQLKVDDIGDAIIEFNGGGIDTVSSTVSFSIADLNNVENITLSGFADLNATGNALANIIAGTVGNNTLDGGAGADILVGFGGNDNYIITGGDVVDEGNLASGGFDKVLTAFSASLLDTAHFKGDIEAIQLLGTAAANITGNALNNTMIGNGAANVINGDLGADLMQGLAGNDVYGVHDLGDVIDEGLAGSSGIDTVNAVISVNLADTVHFKGSIENVTFLGNANISATGNGLGNVLTGNSGNNTLIGMGGNDTMRGLGGNDLYGVAESGDIVDESVAGSGGIDTVNATVSVNLSSAALFRGDIENVKLLGGANLNATGNGLANVLIGNAGANTLIGMGGNDTMRGFGGNDLYGVAESGDIVDESVAGSGGIDTVNATVSVNLSNAALFRGDIENVTLLGGANLNATGNGLANVLIGNAGANTLIGMGGNDTMRGLGGNDLYGVHDLTDIVDESVAGSAGIDSVNSLVNFSLVSVAGAALGKGSIENVTLLGAANAFAFGNGVANVITGNTGANVLAGGLGNDTLTGGAGNDVFVFNTTFNATTNRDVITDMNQSGNDTIRLENAIFTTLTAGGLSDAAFKVSTTGATQLDDRIIYNNANGQLTYDTNGLAAGGSTLVAILDPGLTLTAADFFVV